MSGPRSQRAAGAARPALAPSAVAVAGWQGDLLAAISGVLLPFAFSPFFVWPLAVLAAAGLFLAWTGCAGRRAAWRGALFGVASFGAGVWWIVSSFRFSNIALPVALVLTAGFVAFLALYPALTGLLASRVSRDLPRPAVLLAVFPATFVIGEWLRGVFLSGFTWLQLGYSQVDGPLRGLLPLGGVYATGFVLALVAGALTLFVLERSRRNAAILVLAALGGAGLGAAGDRDWTRPAGAPLRVAVAQGNVPQDQKWRPEMRAPTLERYLSLTAAHPGADLVVWPETALPGQRRVMQPFIDELAARGRATRSAILFGVPEWDGVPARAYNSVYMVGTHEGRYRKRHLVPFGEFLPLDAVLRPITRAMGIPVASFHPGAARQSPLRVDGHELALFICYEIAFGDEVRRSLPAAALLVTVSNDAWFGDSMGPHQHLQMARARSLETGRELVRATNTGISAFVGTRGEVRARLPQFQTGVLTASVQPRTGSTPYVVIGDAPAVALCVLLLLAGGAGTRLRARRSARRRG